MWTIFKVLIEFVTILLLFYVLFFGPEACGLLTPRPGIEPTPAALEGEVLTTGPPGKSLSQVLLSNKRYHVGLVCQAKQFICPINKWYSKWANTPPGDFKNSY